MTAAPAAVLRALGLDDADLVGRGGEAEVYALDETRVVRIPRRIGCGPDLRRRHALVDELRRGAPPFALPELLELGEVEGWAFAIERRLTGRPLDEVLSSEPGDDRPTLVRAHLDAVAALGDLPLEPRGWFGDLLADDPVRAPTWSAYLGERARTRLAAAPGAFAAVDVDELVAALPDATDPRFVHLDAFAGNMLVGGTTITAVLDIGPTSLAGDPRLDVLAAVAYLTAPEITPAASAADHAVAIAWLGERGLSDRLDPARRWLAAYWSAAIDDADLHRWCRRILLEG